jgi:hypothetical protein
LECVFLSPSRIIAGRRIAVCLSRQPMGVKILVEGNLEMEEKILFGTAVTTDDPIIASLLQQMMDEEMEESGEYQISVDENEWKHFHETIKRSK